MQARGPLMMEHRLIEKMLAVIQGELARASRTQTLDPDRVADIVDFFRVYVDRLHHGKEEDILFKSLQQKKLSEEDGRLMTELIAEHGAGRATVKALAEANRANFSIKSAVNAGTLVEIAFPRGRVLVA